MADRPTITNITPGARYDTDTLNANFTAITVAFDTILGLNGTSGSNNTMTGDVDFNGFTIRNASIGTMGGDLNMNSFQINNLAAGSSGGDAINKAQLDAASSLATIDASTSTYTGVGAGAVSRSIAGRLGDAVSVKDFGATGDGATDDVVAIQAALDAMTAGGTLLFPPGDYKITTPVSRIFADGVVFHMIGYGAKIDGSTIVGGGTDGDTNMITLEGSQGASSLLDVSPTEGDFSISLAGTISAADNNIILLSSTDLFNPTRPQYLSGEMVEVKDVTSSTLYALTSPLFDGYTAANTTAHLLAMPTIIVEGIELEMDTEQVALAINYSKNPVVKNCKVHGARYTGIALDYCYGGGAEWNDVYDSWYVGTGTSYCIANLTTQNTVIKNNNLREARHCITNGGQEPSRNVLVKGNTCTMHPDQPNLFSIDTHGNCEFVKIFGNFCEGIVVASINTEIVGNRITGNVASTEAINIFQEIDSDYYIVKDNVVETIGTATVGLWHSPTVAGLNVKRLVVSGNDISSVGAALLFQPRNSGATGCSIDTLELSNDNSFVSSAGSAFLTNSIGGAALTIGAIESSHNTYDAKAADTFVMITAADKVSSSFDKFFSNRTLTSNVDIFSDDATLSNATIEGDTGGAGNGRGVKFTGSGTGTCKIINSSIVGQNARVELVTISDYYERGNDTSITSIINTAGARILHNSAEAGIVIAYGSAAPVANTWKQGDKVYDTTPSAAGFMGFVCVTAGTPGTWKTFGAISA